jgi:carbamoyl-phosphate synthase small subunit
MGAMASGDNINPDDLVDRAKSNGSMLGKDYVQYVSCEQPYAWNQLPWELGTGYGNRTQAESDKLPHVVAVDCGIKHNILRLLAGSGLKVTVVPYNYSSDEILKLKPDGIFLSNGPGDPATLNYIVNSVKNLLGKKPIFGICLGHQILSQAVGGSTYKLPFGHRGGNHPVKDMKTGVVEITVQNHGFAVDEKTLPKSALVRHVNLNDNTVEGLEVEEAKAFSIQYHPESSPGPHDSQVHFKRFYDLITSN